MGGDVHEVYVVCDVDPVEGNVLEQTTHAQLLQVGVLLLQQTAVGGDGV